MSTTRSFKQVNTNDRVLQRIQDNVDDAIRSVITSPILDGRLIVGMALNVGDNGLEHKLNRVPRGYIIVDKNANSNIYTTSKDDKFLTLNVGVAITASIWVF